MALKDDLPLIGAEIVKAGNDKFTGKMQITLHMNQGGIGRIKVFKEQDLKKVPENVKKQYREDDFN